MPGWHQATVKRQAQGKVRVLGIVQEQHPERTRLFMQWKQMQWPMLIDSLNLLGNSAVPLTFFIDEYGIIRAVKPEAKALDAFLGTDFPEPTLAADSVEKDSSDSAHRRQADRLFVEEGDAGIDLVIEKYNQALGRDPDEGTTHFRLGVAYRTRYDSNRRKKGDFSRAVFHWNRALEIDPNQYIWRRRIQQYGPRLDKPYPFYDWVPEARREIAARGEEPIPLAVEPGESEFAEPLHHFAVESQESEGPDPGGRVLRDTEGMIDIEAVVVPDTSAGLASARIHLALSPNLEIRAHWNNEAEDMVLWVDPPADWQVSRRRHTYAIPPQTVSQEVRHLEFEIRGKEQATPPVIVPAYVLYYVCEDVYGTCMFRRQDIRLEIQ